MNKINFIIRICLSPLLLTHFGFFIIKIFSANEIFKQKQKPVFHISSTLRENGKDELLNFPMKYIPVLTARYIMK
jgi:hypothetical protein